MAPARQYARAGAIALLMLTAVPAACDRVLPDAGPPVLELAHDTIRLEPGVSLVDVSVRRDAQEFDPVQVEAGPGDVVRFTAADNGGHTILFEGTRLSPELYAWLQQSGQLRSPPLIASGAAWVITLEGAPPGEYPFRCSTHNAGGRLIVRAR